MVLRIQGKFTMVKSSLRKCYGHHHDLVDRYRISVSQWSLICSTYRKHCTVLYLFTTYYRVCNYINTTGATNGSGSTDPSVAHEFTPVFIWNRNIFEVMISPLPKGTYVSVAYVLALSSFTEILIGATCFRISYHLRVIYSMCMCCWNGATHNFERCQSKN
jgi:hypothetical protein